jgi:acetyl esterase
MKILQTIKVILLRWFYRLANWLAWRKTDLSSITVTELAIPCGDGPIDARVYRESQENTDTLIIYIHGGGWVIGDLKTHDPFCRRLAGESKAVVVALDYRLAPEHKFPAAPRDCLDATRWILANQAQLGLNNARVFIAGDSAGGNLSAIVANQLCPAGQHPLAGQILIYPAVRHCEPPTASCIENAKGYGLTKAIMEWFWETYLPSETRVIDGAIGPLATPMYEELPANLPPALVITAGFDPLRDEGADYAAKLQQSGVATLHQLYTQEMHGFVCSEGPTEAHLEAMALIKGWMNQQGRD